MKRKLKGNNSFTAIVTVKKTGFKYAYAFNAFGQIEANNWVGWKFDLTSVDAIALAGRWGLQDGEPYLLP